ALKEGSRGSTSGRHRARNLLVVSQVAVSFMLLIGAGLMLRSLINLQEINPGFSPENVLALRVNLNFSKYTTNQQTIEFGHRLLDNVHSRPGVLSAALATTYPFNPRGSTACPTKLYFQVEGRPLAEGQVAPKADPHSVSPDFFQTVHIPLIQGRTFTDMDNNDRSIPVPVINQYK